MSEFINVSNIPGFESFTNYEMNTLGDIRNIKKDRFLLQTINVQGYRVVRLTKEDGGAKILPIHRGLCLLFKENPNPQNWVDHINGIKMDNALENLRLVSPSQNNMNRKARRNSKSGIKNITPVTSNGYTYFLVKIVAGDKKVLKLFKRETDTDAVPLEAIEFRDKHLRLLHGQFASFRN